VREGLTGSVTGGFFLPLSLAGGTLIPATEVQKNTSLANETKTTF
jgi:hypothetical protein